MGKLQSMMEMLLTTMLLVLAVGTRAEQIGGDFSLTDQDGRIFHLNQLRGKVVLLFFGYTYCPDICPTELASVAAVLNALEDEADQVQGLFVTVDPERDRPQVLKDYVHYFNERLIGLTGSPDEIERVAGQYRVSYKKHLRADGRYTMDHSAQLYLIDQNGMLSSAVPYGFPAEHVLNLIEGMLKSAPQTGTEVVSAQ